MPRRFYQIRFLVTRRMETIPTCSRRLSKICKRATVCFGVTCKSIPDRSSGTFWFKLEHGFYDSRTSADRMRNVDLPIRVSSFVGTLVDTFATPMVLQLRIDMGRTGQRGLVPMPYSYVTSSTFYFIFIDCLNGS